MCDRLGLPHPDYLWEVLTWEQWQDWRARWFACPWGDYRDDLRTDEMINRLILRLFGGDLGDRVGVWPYVDDKKYLSPDRLKEIGG